MPNNNANNREILFLYPTVFSKIKPPCESLENLDVATKGIFNICKGKTNVLVSAQNRSPSVLPDDCDVNQSLGEVIAYSACRLT
ncbi:hypothetical protein E2C01_036184 [Portunus trituberculatus]|uniref:Uncharacterized protein n=1 Tax=Portunus trituberculatus TaxID=210409 RepID=A0A5B7F816_PORTR|nr:hypothetical protein [Portunus trituberculatus]